jgi:uncharacterized protein
MKRDGQIDYVEFPASDLAGAKRFYAEAFGWSFTDYGPTYAAFEQGLEGGFQGDAAEAPSAPLVVLWADDLQAMQARVEAAGGTVTRPIFAFPGGRRFHFRDPAGNELAVVSGG